MWIAITAILAGSIGFYFWKKKHRKVVSVTNIVATYIKKKGNMEQYNITWTLSPSTFVEKQQLFAGLNGAAAGQIGADMPSSQDSVVASFNTGDAVSLFIRVLGDNGTQADSSPITFTAVNQEAVKAASNVVASWVKHID